jgi:predicted enzyme related to lactoylglutathione lyase
VLAAAVTELFVSIHVADMSRATAFYTGAFGANASFASLAWSSLMIAGVRLGLFYDAAYEGGRTGLHLVVTDLAVALAAVEAAGGRVVVAPIEVAAGVVIAEVADPEGNLLTLRAA